MNALSLDENESIYPSCLFPLSKIGLKHKEITEHVKFVRYLGFTLCEALGFMYLELILREKRGASLSKLIITNLEEFLNLNVNKNADQEKLILNACYLKLQALLQKYNDIMKGNDKALYEIIYDYYKKCQKSDELKTASKLIIKNLGFLFMKEKVISEKNRKKYCFMELKKEKLSEIDLNHLSECFKLHIHLYYLDSKEKLETFNYKEKYPTEKPFHVKILQKEGKFYGLYSSGQNIELDNSIFTKDQEIEWQEASNLTTIEESSDNRKSQILISDPPPRPHNPSENQAFKQEIINKEPIVSAKPQEKIPESQAVQEILNKEPIVSAKPQEKIPESQAVQCCLCHKVSFPFFTNQSCKHSYCSACVASNCEKKKYINLCFERLCSKSLSLSQLEKFLYEISLANSSEREVSEPQGSFVEYEQECMICSKKDKIFLESFMQFEYYKCIFCKGFSCIIHQSALDRCYCFCPKCLEPTLYEGSTRKRCFRCDEVYCLICFKKAEKCSCYCKDCGTPKEIQSQSCEKCSNMCALCKIIYERRNTFFCLKGQHLFCRFCAFKEAKFVHTCLVCKNKLV